MDSQPALTPEISDVLNQGIFGSMKHYAKQHAVPIMQDEGILFLVDWIHKNNISTVLEIGSAIGFSSIAFAILGKATVVTVEKNPLMIKELKSNVHEAECDSIISVVEGDALDIDLSGIEMVDLLFIDAAKAQYQKFFMKYSSLVRPGGWIVTDNLLFRGQVEDPSTILSRNRRQLVNKIRRYFEWLKEQPGYDTQIIDIGDGISLTQKR